MKKKCICKNCEDCRLFRAHEVEIVENGHPTGVKQMRTDCMIQVIANSQHYFMSCIDGMQEATNEARNRAIENKSEVLNMGKEFSKMARALMFSVNQINNMTKIIKELEGGENAINKLSCIEVKEGD
jgi:hypothetical protein